MASSREAFLKLDKWKNSKTVLKLTVYERGAEDHFTGSIDHVDFDEEIVGFVLDGTRKFLPPLDLREADFTIEPRTLVADDPRFGTVIFEEVLLV